MSPPKPTSTNTSLLYFTLLASNIYPIELPTDNSLGCVHILNNNRNACFCNEILTKIVNCHIQSISLAWLKQPCIKQCGHCSQTYAGNHVCMCKINWAVVCLWVNIQCPNVKQLGVLLLVTTKANREIYILLHFHHAPYAQSARNILPC